MIRVKGVIRAKGVIRVNGVNRVKGGEMRRDCEKWGEMGRNGRSVEK